MAFHQTGNKDSCSYSDEKDNEYSYRSRSTGQVQTEESYGFSSDSAPNTYRSPSNNSMYDRHASNYGTSSLQSEYIEANPSSDQNMQREILHHQTNNVYPAQADSSQYAMHRHGNASYQDHENRAPSGEPLNVSPYTDQSAQARGAEDYQSSIYASPETAMSSNAYAPNISQQPQLPRREDEESIACPYGCGTVLTGVHAQGNLTRHLRSQACMGSGRTKVKHVCKVAGCGREYTRSDGLGVHMRKQHGALPPLSRAEEEYYKEVGY